MGREKGLRGEKKHTTSNSPRKNVPKKHYLWMKTAIEKKAVFPQALREKRRRRSGVGGRSRDSKPQAGGQTSVLGRLARSPK